MKATLLIVTAVLVLVAALAGGIWLSWDFAYSRISFWGLLALVLGCVATLALAGGLMALMYYSRRHGYDAAERQVPPCPARRR